LSRLDVLRNFPMRALDRLTGVRNDTLELGLPVDRQELIAKWCKIKHSSVRRSRGHQQRQRNGRQKPTEWFILGSVM
jgi:hypothetical protein